MTLFFRSFLLSFHCVMPPWQRLAGNLQSLSGISVLALSEVQVISVRLFRVLPHQQLDAVKKDFKRTFLVLQKYTLFDINMQKNSLAVTSKVYFQTRKKILLIMMNISIYDY